MKKGILLLVIFFIITLIFFYPILRGEIPFPGDLLVSSTPYNTVGSIPNKAQGTDVIQESLPWKSLVIDSFKNGHIPFWTPYNFSGNPLLANFQSAVFDPINIVFLLPFSFAWTVSIFLGPFLAGIFTFLFLREIKVGKIASIFGGIAFSFSSYMVVWIEYGNITHTYLWLPLALFFTQRLITKLSIKNFVFLLGSLLFSLAGGYIQGYFYLTMLVFCYYLFSAWKSKTIVSRKTGIFFLMLISPGFLFLFQLLPTIAMFQDSSRGGYPLSEIQKLLNPIWYTVTTILPNFFGHPASRNHWFSGTYIERVSYFGIIPFVFAIAALFSWKKKQEILFFGVILFVTFFLATDFIFNRYIYLLPIPVISTTVPTRILGIFGFCGSILASFGVDFFLKRQQKRQLIFVLSSVFAFVAFCGVFSVLAPKVVHAEWTMFVGTIQKSVFYAVVFLGFLAVAITLQFKKILAPNIIATFLIFATIADLFYLFQKITPFAPEAFFYPQTPIITYMQKEAGINRFWGYGSGYIQPNFQTFDRTFSPEGRDPLHLKAYTAFIETARTGKIPETLPRPDANIVQGYGVGNFATNPYRQKLFNILGVKYVLNKDESLLDASVPQGKTFPEKTYQLVWNSKPWQVYENNEVASRFFLTNEYRVETNQEKLIKTFYSDSFDEKKTILLEKKPSVDVSHFVNGKVILADYQPNIVTFTTQTDAPALLFLSDTYSPNWKVTVDGKEKEVLRADYAFRAVVVPEGKHTVTFSYLDKDFFNGVKVSALYALGLVIFFIIMRKPLRKEKK